MIFDKDKAIYLQIADYISDGIVKKKWLPKSRIPSTRDLAIELEVNPNTVVKSYNYLVEQNIIYNKRGIGYMVEVNALNKIISDRKNIFLKHELKKIFETMDMLNIEINELVDFYKEHKNNENNQSYQAINSSRT